MRKSKDFLRDLKSCLVNVIGVWFYDVKRLPVGTLLCYFLKYRTEIKINNIFDVGANIGNTAKLFYRYFPKTNITCFEPFNNTYNALLKNIKNNSSIRAIKIALGDSQNEMEIPVMPESQSDLNSLLLSLSNESNTLKKENIQIETIDNFLKKHSDIQSIDLLKIDTEGYDKKVIEGALETIKAGRIKMIFTEVGFSSFNKRHIHFTLMLSFMESLGFHFIGLFGMDIRKLEQNMQFGNALFIYKTEIVNLNLK